MGHGSLKGFIITDLLLINALHLGDRCSYRHLCTLILSILLLYSTSSISCVDTSAQFKTRGVMYLCVTKGTEWWEIVWSIDFGLVSSSEWWFMCSRVQCCAVVSDASDVLIEGAGVVFVCLSWCVCMHFIFCLMCARVSAMFCIVYSIVEFVVDTMSDHIVCYLLRLWVQCIWEE